MENLEGKLSEYKLETKSSSTLRATHRPTNRKVNLTKLVVKKTSKRYKGLVECIKEGVVYVYDMFSAETKHSVYVYIILPLASKPDPNLCSLEKAVEAELHHSRKALIFKNLVVALKTIHKMNLSHLAIDLTNIWIEDMFYVYLGPFSLDEKKDELDCVLAFAAPEILLCQDYSYNPKYCDLWSIGVVYCSLMLKGFYNFVSKRIKSLEDYLIFYDLLIGYPEEGGLSYMPNSTFHKLKRLIKKFKLESLSKSNSEDVDESCIEPVFDEEVIGSWAKQIQECQLLSRIMNWEPKSRLGCEKILEYDLFRDQPKIPTNRDVKEDDYGPFKRKKDLLRDSKDKLKKILDQPRVSEVKFKQVKNDKEYLKRISGSKKNKISAGKNFQQREILGYKSKLEIERIKIKNSKQNDLMTIKIEERSALLNHESIQKTVKTNPVINYNPRRLNTIKSDFPHHQSKISYKHPISHQEEGGKNEKSFRSKSRNDSYEKYLSYAQIKKRRKSSVGKHHRKINLKIENHNLKKNQRKYVTHRTNDNNVFNNNKNKNLPYFSADVRKKILEREKNYPTVSRPSTKKLEYSRREPIQNYDPKKKLILNEENIIHYGGGEQQITFDKQRSSVSSPEKEQKKYSEICEEKKNLSRRKITNEGIVVNRRGRSSSVGYQPGSKEVKKEIYGIDTLKSNDELFLRGEIIHTEETEEKGDGEERGGNVPLSEKLKGLFSAKERKRGAGELKKIRILVYTSEMVFNRELFHELNGGILEAEYKLSYRFIENDVVQDSLSTEVDSHIVKCETNFEIIIDYKQWEELLEIELILSFTFSKENIGDSVHLGTCTIDLKSLFFSFFNGRETDTKMEKRLLNVLENQTSIIGVIEAATAISTTLDDNESCSYTLGKKEEIKKSTTSSQKKNIKKKEFEKPTSITIPGIENIQHKPLKNLQTLQSSEKRKKKGQLRPKELETPKEYVSFENGRRRHKKIPNHLKGFKNRKYHKQRGSEKSNIIIEENSPDPIDNHNSRSISRNKSLPNYSIKTKSKKLDVNERERHTTKVAGKPDDLTWESVKKRKLDQLEKIIPKRNPKEILKRLQKEYEQYNKEAASKKFQTFASNTANSSLNNSYNDAIKELRNILYDD